MMIRPVWLHSLLFCAFAIKHAAYAQAAHQDEEPIYLLSTDESFHFEMVALLGESIYSGADIGPVLGAVKNIKSGDFESFSTTFFDLASHTKVQAENPDLAYDPINVRDAWFAASNYFRRADFYLHGNWDDPRINAYWDEQVYAFDKAIAALPIPGQRVTIPATGFDIEGIWFPASTDPNTKRPTLIMGNGYDGSQEDMYHTLVVPALERGWNVLTYEGPGQPVVRRRQNLGFIPDWERVVTPIVDYILLEHGQMVDDSRLALFGYSFGGYLAARAAAFEPRLAAVLLDGGIWSTYDAFTSQLDNDTLQILESGDGNTFDTVVSGLLRNPQAPTNIRWAIEQGLWAFNTRSPYEFLQSTKQYTMEGVVDKIRMPVWIADAEFEGVFKGQAEALKKAVGDKATYVRFNGTAGYHCQVGALQELGRNMFAWLNQTLA